MNEVERSKEEEKIKKKKEGPVSALLFFLKAGCSCTLAARPPACNGCVRVKEEKKGCSNKEKGEKEQNKRDLICRKRGSRSHPTLLLLSFVCLCVCVCVCVSSFSCRLSLSSSFFLFSHLSAHPSLSLSLSLSLFKLHHINCIAASLPSS